MPEQLSSNYFAELHERLCEQQRTIKALTQIAKDLFQVADKSQPTFRSAAEAFHELIEKGAI